MGETIKPRLWYLDGGVLVEVKKGASVKNIRQEAAKLLDIPGEVELGVVIPIDITTKQLRKEGLVRPGKITDVRVTPKKTLIRLTR